jgi:hypothetical protein
MGSEDVWRHAGPQPPGGRTRGSVAVQDAAKCHAADLPDRAAHHPLSASGDTIKALAQPLTV